MNNAPQSTEVHPWYREPWPWILMAGPALAIVGCAITIYFAMTRFADEPIYDGGVRRGLVVERSAPSAPLAPVGQTAGAAAAVETSAQQSR